MQHDPQPQPLVALPVHPLPELPGFDAWRLLVSDGAKRVALDLDAVSRLPHAEVVDAFACLEGWTAGPLRWRGVGLSTLLGVLGTASRPFVAVSAGDFRTVLPLVRAPAETLLADALNGEPLPREHGGPLRLVVPGGICFQSVKWVQRIQLCDSDEGDSAREVALARLRTQANG